mmetsp:Transcript_60379/g.127926  ORF Transcript_60379/g.127926 Transcript_60379/m.127926 type:complete len:576 (-) Transcript_60379:387-2114(-)
MAKVWRSAACLASALLLVLAAPAPVRADNLAILPPLAGKQGPTSAWICIPGAQIDKDAYRPLADAVQTEMSSPLWVAIIGTYFMPTAVPPELGARIDGALKEMEKQGLDLASVKLFYGGHSLGSVFIQDHLASHHGSSGPMGGTVSVLGQVLMGGFLQRKYTYPSFSYPVTTLTLGGELDGLARCTRLAEAFYQAKGRESDFPVEIVHGMNHMQFASGKPPLLVQARDLLPEISEETAHGSVAKLIAPYFQRLAAGSEASGKTAPGGVSKASVDFFAPIIEAYELEGSRDFNAPEQIGGPGAKSCIKGGCPSKSAWAPEAQKIISAVEGWDLNVTNEYVDCKSTPLSGAEFHLPVITNNTATKTISITTYSQASWDDAMPSWFQWKEIFDTFDTGFVATSAEELATKLASRQCSLILGAGRSNVSFSEDDPDFCAMTNEKAYQWALATAGKATQARFQKYGQKYTFGKDIQKAGGPLFLNARLQFKEVPSTDGSGDAVIEVSAPAQKTEMDYWQKHFHIPRPSFIPDPGCFHYCKLLSPARALEWIYVDSLRAKRRSLPKAADEVHLADEQNLFV